MARDVLRQIQAFGEAANDEFDVQWSVSSPKPFVEEKAAVEGQTQTKKPVPPQRKSSSEARIEYFMEDDANVFDASLQGKMPSEAFVTDSAMQIVGMKPRKKTSKEEPKTRYRKTAQQTNPFLESAESAAQWKMDDEIGAAAEDEEGEESGDDGIVVRQEVRILLIDSMEIDRSID
jgi:hypothetical protein